MPLAYFGERWDAPAWDDAVEVPVPVGQSCLHCLEPIEEGDSGIMLGHLRRARPGEAPMGRMSGGEDVVVVGEPDHLECHLRAVRGSVAHLAGRCLCTGHAESGSGPAASFREEALAAMQWLLEHGGRTLPERPTPRPDLE